MSINELFGTTSTATAVNSRSLPGTAELTAKASNFAAHIITAMNADIDNYRTRIQASVTDNRELDKLIEELGLIGELDCEFLADIDDAIVDGMLKSQQSKRSRTRGKQMTVENYNALMTAAVAEYMIRMGTGRTKAAHAAGRAAGTVDYTIEQLENFSDDQEALRKEIRNIQSKKSIMKGKATFTEADERWQALCKAEQQLKDLRVGGATTTTITVEVDTTKDALLELFGEMTIEDVRKLKSANAHELLEHIYSMVHPADDAQEESTEG